MKKMLKNTDLDISLMQILGAIYLLYHAASYSNDLAVSNTWINIFKTKVAKLKLFNEQLIFKLK